MTKGNRKRIEGSYPELFPKDLGERLERLTELAGCRRKSSPSASASRMTA